MPIQKEIQGRVPVKIWTQDVDNRSLEQLHNLASLPLVFHHVAAMADVHAGIGATIGAVVATKGAVIPSAVGVDIGCGMAAVRLPFPVSAVEGRRAELRAAIERVIPVGCEGNRQVTPVVRQWQGWKRFHDLHPKVQDLLPKTMEQLGSLGSGNHFIEVCRDMEDKLWVMLHSGSRYIGKTLADVHIQAAKVLMRKLSVHLPDADLAYLPEGRPEYDAYLHDLSFAQDYARENRRVMMGRILHQMADILNKGESFAVESEINCHHNYAALEMHYGEQVLVTRKGAVRAGPGELGIIPGSMGTQSYIVCGKGSAEAFDSCSHGAGRRMSRHEAKRRFTVEDLRRETAGVECRKDGGVLDEIPSAYKPIAQVMADQSDLIEVVAELKGLLCVKG